LWAFEYMIKSLHNQCYYTFYGSIYGQLINGGWSFKFKLQIINKPTKHMHMQVEWCLIPCAKFSKLKWCSILISLGWISKLIWIQFSSSFMQCHLIFSFKWKLIFIKSIHFFHYLISWSSLEVCRGMELKCKWIKLQVQVNELKLTMVCLLSEFDPPRNKDDGSVCFSMWGLRCKDQIQ